MKSAPNHPVCGAKNRQGQPCQRPPSKGRARCKLHGGATPKGQRNAIKHGIYTKTLSPEERDLYDAIEVGTLDSEIRFAKLMLARAIETNAAVREDPNSTKNLAGFELTEITRQTGDNSSGKGKTNLTSKRADLTAVIITLMGRIAGMEKTRAELIAAAANNPTELNVRFVAEIPPEEPLSEWLQNYGQDAPKPQEGEDAP